MLKETERKLKRELEPKALIKANFYIQLKDLKHQVEAANARMRKEVGERKAKGDTLELYIKQKVFPELRESSFLQVIASLKKDNAILKSKQVGLLHKRYLHSKRTGKIDYKVQWRLTVEEFMSIREPKYLALMGICT